MRIGEMKETVEELRAQCLEELPVNQNMGGVRVCLERLFVTVKGSVSVELET